MQESPSLYIPRPHGPVLARRRQGAALGIKSDAQDPPRVPFEHAQELARFRVPDADRIVLTRLGENVTAVTGGCTSALGKRNVVNPASMAF